MIVKRYKLFSLEKLTEDYFRRYPKLKELKVYIDNRKKLKDIQFLLDDLGIMKDWIGLETTFEDPWDSLEETTAEIQDKMGEDNWIPCLGAGECLSYNTKDGMFYELSPYSKNKLGKRFSTVREYNKYLIKDVQDCINRALKEYPEDYKSKSIKNKVDSIIPSLKRIFKLS